MTNSLSLDQLKQAIGLKEKIAALEAELVAILGGDAPAPAATAAAVVPPRRGRPPGKRAASSEAETGEIAPTQAAPSTPSVVVKKSGRGGARIITAAARAKMAASQQARWAKVRAAKGK